LKRRSNLTDVYVSVPLQIMAIRRELKERLSIKLNSSSLMVGLKVYLFLLRLIQIVVFRL
jgi:hypothetical protein